MLPTAGRKRPRPGEAAPGAAVVVQIGTVASAPAPATTDELENAKRRGRLPVVAAAGEPVAAEALRLRRSRRDESCWGCINNFGSANYRSGEPFHAQLLAMYHELKHGDVDHLCAELAALHAEGIAATAAALGAKCTPWPSDKVKEHLTWHMLVPEMQIRATLEQVSHEEAALADLLFRNVPRGDDPERREWVLDANVAGPLERARRTKAEFLRLALSLERRGRA